MQPNPYSQYRTNRIKTASTGELVVMLYDGAIRYLNTAIPAMDARQYDISGHNLFQAQEVVLELYAGLDYEQGGDLAHNLSRLYRYMHQTLVQANVKKDTEAVRGVIKLLSQLRDAWRTVVYGAGVQPDASDRVLVAGGIAA